MVNVTISQYNMSKLLAKFRTSDVTLENEGSHSGSSKVNNVKQKELTEIEPNKIYPVIIGEFFVYYLTGYTIEKKKEK